MKYKIRKDQFSHVKKKIPEVLQQHMYTEILNKCSSTCMKPIQLRLCKERKAHFADLRKTA